jgi:hypothetical protein
MAPSNNSPGTPAVKVESKRDLAGHTRPPTALRMGIDLAVRAALGHSRFIYFTIPSDFREKDTCGKNIKFSKFLARFLLGAPLGKRGGTSLDNEKKRRFGAKRWAKRLASEQKGLSQQNPRGRSEHRTDDLLMLCP